MARNRTGRPLPEAVQATLRELIRTRGLNAVAQQVGVPRSTVAQGAAGADCHRTTAIAIEVGLGLRGAASA